jgi:hypothetical protein
MKTWTRLALLGLALPLASIPASLQAQGTGRKIEIKQSQEPMYDMKTYANPLPPTDAVWIQQLTELELRDAIKAGKTNVLIPTGSVEDNGPWLTTNKHNDVLQVSAESIARRMGNMLVAPIIPFEQGDPAKQTMPGGIRLSAAVYQGVLKDVATSLKAQGFKNVFFIGDSGGNVDPDIKVVADLTEEWKGSGARAFYVPEYYDYDELLALENEKMGVPEVRYSDRFHDNYYITTMIMVGNPEAVNWSERVKLGKASINGFSLTPLEKAVWHGRQLVEARTDDTIAGIKRLLGQTTQQNDN